jgi:hypothetical protein
LAFGVNGVEGKAGLSRSRDAGDHGYGIVGNLEADVLEVVYTSAGNHDGRGLVKDCRLIDDLGLIAHGSSHALTERHRVLHSKNFGGSLNEKLYVAGESAANDALATY